MTGPGERECMSVEQAAEFLGVERKTLYDACGRGEVPHRRVGRRIVIHRSVLLAWLGALSEGAK